MAITIYHAPRLDDLVTVFARMLHAQPPPPFEQEVVAVPPNGVHRWVDQMVSRGGIAAGIDYRHPRHVAELFLPDQPDPWDPAALVWHILDLTNQEPESVVVPALSLQSHQGHHQRYGVGVKLARLFDHYAKQRPTMLRAWLAGEHTDGSGPLPSQHAWQAELFTKLVSHLGVVPAPLRDLDAGGIASGRLHLFGYSQLAPGDVDALAQVGADIDVYSWVLDRAGARDADFSPTAWWAQRLPRARIQDVGKGLAQPRVSIHACAGPTRQVEVLREELTHLFATEPDLQPRDVVVVSPDPATYGPLFQAYFSPHTHHPGAKLRISAAGAGAANPLVTLAAQMVGFVADRVRSSDLIGLLHHEQVQEKFGFTTQDVETLTAWVTTTGIRWGFSQDDRDRFGLHTAQNTVGFGLDRLVLGVLSPGEQPVGGVLAYSETTSTDIDLMGRFVELTTRLDHGLTTLGQATSLGQWSQGVQELVLGIAQGNDWQEADFHQRLAGLSQHAQVGVTQADMRQFFTDLARPRLQAVNHRSGGITVAPLGALHGVGHKVVCMVGMDDEAFALREGFDGDDLIALGPLPGEKTRREHEREIFYQGVESATQHLIITYTGIDPDRGEQRYPATVVADVVDQAERAPAAHSALRVATHPLHSFDPAYFTPGSGLTSFDTQAAKAAHAGEHTTPRPPLVPTRIPTAAPQEIHLRQMHQFFKHPVRYFFRDVLGITIPDTAQVPPTLIPTSLEGLDRWRVGTDFIEAAARSGWQVAEEDHEQLRGLVPPGQMGTHEVQDVKHVVHALVDQASQYVQTTPEEMEVDIEVEGRALQGNITKIHGKTLVRVQFSNHSPTHLFQAWLDLLAVTLAQPDQGWQAVVISRDKTEAHTTVITSPGQDKARVYLHQLIDLFHRGMCEPLPLPPKTAGEWARVARNHQPLTGAKRAEAFREASKVWSRSFPPGSGENHDPYHVWMWAGEVDLPEVLAIPAPPQEQWVDEPSRFGQLALRMWEGLYDHLV